MVTRIENIIDNDFFISDDVSLNIDDNISDQILSDDISEESLIEIIMDLSRNLKERIFAFEKYYMYKEDNSIEIISTLTGIYHLSGSKLIEQFFYHICINSNVSGFLKIECAKSILDYEDKTLDNLSESEKTPDLLIEIDNRNKNRISVGYKALNIVCSNMQNVPTPCRVEAICKLMESPNHKDNTVKYLEDFVRDDNIACDYRYKTILKLENIGSDILRRELFEKFSDKKFVKDIYEKMSKNIQKLLPKVKIDVNNKKLWTSVLSRFSYDELCLAYPNKTENIDFYIYKAQYAFLFYENNDIYYRIVSGQYLLQKCKLSDPKRYQIERCILNFAKNTSIDYNRRGDATDVLLKLGTIGMKQEARKIITLLGNINGQSYTVFDNAQNVHTYSVEESVSEILEYLSGLPLMKIKDIPLDFSYINSQIEEMLKEQKSAIQTFNQSSSKPLNTKILNTKTKSNKTKEKCSYCENNICDEHFTEDKYKFCTNECLRFFYRDEKIRLSMNRIFIDRALYSKYNSSLINILLKIWTYLSGNEHEKEMKKRLLEELEEMSGTCSSGYASRLVNIISGFGEFNIRISWEDQIIANFTGRLNALVRNIIGDSSIFRKEKLKDVLYLWFLKNNDLYMEIKEKILCIYQEKNIKQKIVPISEIYDYFLHEDRQKKIDICIENFADCVVNEMAVSSSMHSERQNFLLFFRTHMSIIREELYGEFKDLISDSDFDLYFRKALMKYEGDA